MSGILNIIASSYTIYHLSSQGNECVCILLFATSKFFKGMFRIYSLYTIKNLSVDTCLKLSKHLHVINE